MLKHLMKELKQHAFDYFLLTTAGVVMLCCVILFKGSHVLQFSFVLFFALFYIGWGMYHHMFEKTIRLKNVIEYILIALAVILLIKVLILP